MNELLTDVFIAVMYVGTILGMCTFLGIVCKLGDLGFMLLGWLDSKFQDRKNSPRSVSYPRRMRCSHLSATSTAATTITST